MFKRIGTKIVKAAGEVYWWVIGLLIGIIGWLIERSIFGKQKQLEDKMDGLVKSVSEIKENIAVISTRQEERDERRTGT